MTNNEWKIIVIGAGPAGLSFALETAKKGYEVTVVERFSDVTRSFCGEYVDLSPILDKGLPKKCETCLRSKTKKIVVKFIDEDFHELSEIKLGTNNVLLDSGCLKEKLESVCTDYGVKFKFNTILKDLSISKNDVTLKILNNGKSKRIKGDIIIGADGSNSVIRRKLVPNSNIRSLPSIRKTFMLQGYPTGEFRFYLAGPFKLGYGWIYPAETLPSGLRANIGVGYIPKYVNVPISEMLNQFLKHLKNEGYFIKDLPNTGMIGNTIPYSGIVKPSGGKHFLLIGDALGTVYSVVGGGLEGAIVSGFQASKYIQTKVKKNDLDFSSWTKYVLGSPWGKKIEQSAKIVKLGESIYSRQNSFFNLLGNMVNYINSDLIYKVSNGSVKPPDIIKFLGRHPVLTLKILYSIIPLVHKPQKPSINFIHRQQNIRSEI